MNSTISWTFDGTLEVSAGTVNAGTGANDNLQPNNTTAGTLRISGGTVNVAGRVTGTGNDWNFVMSGGVLTIGTVSSNSGFGNFSMNTGASTFNMTGGTIIIERDDTGGGGTFGYLNNSATGSFTGGTLQIGDGSSPARTIGIDTTVPIYNLTVNSGSVIAQVQNQAITVTNNVTISSGTLTANGFNITVGGNWTNNGTFTPTTPGTGVTFNSSTSSQTIGGSSVTTFYRLVLNNTFGTMPQIVLSQNTGVSATGRLTMSSGVVNLAGFSFTIANSASGALVHSLASTAGWMYGGNFVRAVPATAIAMSVLPANNVDGFFPVGSLVDFRPFFVGKSNTVNSNGNITVSHTRLATVTTVSILDGTTIVARRDDSWAVSHSGSAGTYGIRYGGTGLGVVFSLAHLHSCLAATVVGTHVAATSISLTDPRVERSGLTFAQFSGNTFYVGSDNVLSSLPIELLHFNAVLQPDGVALNWATASELNNDFFTIERATDIEKFENVKIVKGQGTKGSQTNYYEVDQDPLVGTSYYRLKQTDYDGNSSYSVIRKVEALTVRPRFTVYPNPAVDNRFNFELTGANPGDEVPINVLNAAGIPVFEATFKADQNGKIKTNVDLGAISSGLYIVRIKATIGMAQKIIIQ